jgi:hypothetical protein
MFLTSWHPFLPKTLKMGKTSVPEMLVAHQNLTLGYNPKMFKQQNFTFFFLYNAINLSNDETPLTYPGKCLP